ncbi:MAG: three-Cys-motif partner protein TcmP [Microbacterium sp.]|uniref:three-Cys-motif partner protein TcmP n=1 Tax=Microbacterium sp. TaxID=51671 RepID=UPI0025D5A36A|nr:three-Cys-motif partner protein TcmP [Microbacterium sp.]MBQ9915863.1 three-Cys-motif partner protein TcmP [Microbacterium sp.]
MNNNTNFFADGKGPAAVLKHGVLKRYLSKFAGATSSTSPGNRVGFLDGYAGEGEYVNPTTGETSEGSPRIALKIAADLRDLGREMRTVFVEKDKKAFTSLKSVVDSASDPHAVALHGDIAQHISGALIHFQNMPALVFLDPFGSALDHATTVNAILGRPGTQPTELLLNFSLQALRRMGARIYEKEGASGRGATLARVDHWLGGDWWREHFQAPEILALPQKDRPHAASLRVADLHASRIRDATNCGRYSVPIHRRPADKPIFVLMLFYPRQIAAFPFNEAVSLALEDWRKFLHEVDLAEAELADRAAVALISAAESTRIQFEADEAAIKRDAIHSIKNAITEALVTRQRLSVRSELSLVMGGALGIGRTLHLRAAWKELAKEGIVTDCPKGALDKAVITKA